MHRNLPVAVLLLLFAVPSLVFAASEESELRTWKDSTGVFSVEASLVDVTDGKVQLKKADGTTLSVPLEKLSESDQAYIKFGLRRRHNETPARGKGRGSAAEARELAHDDGKMAGKRSIAGAGHAVTFEAPDDSWQLTAVRLHGARYGYPQPPREDFHIYVCDANTKVLADHRISYATFKRGEPDWVTMKIPPTIVPAKFTICVGFDPTQTKGVFVSFDAEGTGNSLVGLPEQMQPFSNGDWLIRATIEPAKGAPAEKDGRRRKE